MSFYFIPCRLHLPGNQPCPYRAIYAVTWQQHRPDPTPLMLTRTTCIHHLPRAIDDALNSTSASAASAGVSVRIVNNTDREPAT